MIDAKLPRFLISRFPVFAFSNVLSFVMLVGIMLVGGWGFRSTPAFAQQVPELVTQTYVAALQSGSIPALQAMLAPLQYQTTLQQTGGRGSYPILKDLGAIKSVQLSTLQEQPPFLIFLTRVSHERGFSDWQFSYNKTDQKIYSAILTQVSLQAPIAQHAPKTSTFSNSLFPPGSWGNITGGQNNIIANAQSAIKPDIYAGVLPFPDVQAPTAPAAPAAPTPLAYPCQNLPRSCGTVGPAQLKDTRLVELLFVTDRVAQNGPQSVIFTGDRQGSLSFGAVSIHIPNHHKIGQIELPGAWKLWGFEIWRERQDDTKHFAVRKLAILPIPEWDRIAQQKGTKSALVFVHGFANSFEDAVFRNAQMVYDLQYQGLAVLYSWSSRGQIADYRYDIDSAYAGRDGFIFLLKKLNDLGIEHVNVLAHSMGNLVVLDALKNNVATSTPVRLGQLIMAAPDVPRDTFIRQLPEIQKILAGATLYASAADKALAASKLIAIYPRAGDVPPDGPVVLPQLDTIDVTAIGDEFLGLNHSEFATNRAVMDDLKILIDKNDRPPRLNQIRGFPEPPGVSTYWRYVP